MLTIPPNPTEAERLPLRSQGGAEVLDAASEFVRQHSHLGWIGEKKLARLGGAQALLHAYSPQVRPLASLVAGFLPEMQAGDSICIAGHPELELAILEVLRAFGNEVPTIVQTLPALEVVTAASSCVSLYLCGEGHPADYLDVLKVAAQKDLSAVFLLETGLDVVESLSLPPELDTDILARIVVDGDDLLAVFRVAQESIAHARRGQGPTLVVCTQGDRSQPPSKVAD